MATVFASWRCRRSGCDEADSCRPHRPRHERTWWAFPDCPRANAAKELQSTCRKFSMGIAYQDAWRVPNLQDVNSHRAPHNSQTPYEEQRRINVSMIPARQLEDSNHVSQIRHQLTDSARSHGARHRSSRIRAQRITRSASECPHQFTGIRPARRFLRRQRKGCTDSVRTNVSNRSTQHPSREPQVIAAQISRPLAGASRPSGRDPSISGLYGERCKSE